MMCGQTAGDIYIPSDIHADGISDMRRVAQSVVYDSTTHTIHLKLVNHTDQTLAAHIDSRITDGADKTATLSTLTSSDLMARDASLTTKTMPTASLSSITLPPHSFTVISISGYTLNR